MIGTVSKEEVSRKVCALVHACMGMEEEESVLPTTTFLGSRETGGLEAEGFDFVQLKFELGREFGIVISANQLFAKADGWMEFAVSDKMSVDDAVDYICQRLGIEDE